MAAVASLMPTRMFLLPPASSLSSTVPTTPASRPRVAGEAGEAGLDADQHGPTPWDGAGTGTDSDEDPARPLAVTPAKQPRAQPQQREGGEEEEGRRLVEVGGTPLVRRVARRRAPAQARRRWPMAEATLILERMYGPGACYRSQRQQLAIEHILASHG
ncbi:hypothetical protein BJY00DRAFT_315859 [Aspergillus carlsbadensis]|nr:hypothetical protein BJY00DRAFT_315859 [Aspergillus carlsbadensis]